MKPNTTIKAGNFIISIGRESHQVAIISKFTGEFVKFKDIKKGGKLAKVKRAFKRNICDSTSFFFEWMTTEQTEQLIKKLK